MLDIFQDNAFSVLSLTDAINKIPRVPTRIAQLGLFTESRINKTHVAVEMRNGVLTLIGPTPRGGPGHTITKPTRNLRSVIVPHFEINDNVWADEVQGVRAFGSETEVETVMGKVAERLSEHEASMDATQEYARVGAIKGVVTYYDNTTLDLYDLFEVTAPAEIDFDLDNANPAEGALRRAIAGAIRQGLQNLPGVAVRGWHAFCGDAFFDDLMAHVEVRETYLGYAEAARLREGYVAGDSPMVFPFGGITWENYTGEITDADGTVTTQFIDTNKCHIFPVGVPGLFRSYYAPADYVETVNTLGQRLYTKQYNMANDKGIHLDTQMNSLDICTRPMALVKGRRT